jgi:hypothetical protein
MNVQDLARALSAAGSVKLPESEEEGVYLVHVSDGNVVERFWTGTESKNKTVVAEGAKADTSASYLVAVSPEEVRLSSFPLGKRFVGGLTRFWMPRYNVVLSSLISPTPSSAMSAIMRLKSGKIQGLARSGVLLRAQRAS